MFNIGEKVLDKELNVIVTVEDKEWQNGWYVVWMMELLDIDMKMN